MKTTGEEPIWHRRPGLVYRNTDPCPMREFVKNNLNEETNISNTGKLDKNIDKAIRVIISGDDEEDMKKNASGDEHFLVSTKLTCFILLYPVLYPFSIPSTVR